MTLTCPICEHKASQFRPIGSVETEAGRYKLRSCPKCNSDEWSRLVVAWVKDNVSFPRRGRILTLSAPLAMRTGLHRLKNVSLVDGETTDLIEGAFAADAFDLIVIGETWTQDARDLATSIPVKEALRDKGWYIVMPMNGADAAKKTENLLALGFSAPVRPWARHEEFAVPPALPFVVVQKMPAPKPKPAAPTPADELPLAFLTDDPGHIEIAPAPLQRDWMEATDSKFPYLCLPMNIANTHGWEWLCPVGFSATWNGGKSRDAVTITPDSPDRAVGYSNFGYGVLTFRAHGHFRTPPGINLYVTGPVNRPKHGIQALSGIVETDWSDFFFTINWLFTVPNHTIRFEKGEPFGMFFPIPRDLIEQVDPVILRSSDDPETWQRYLAHNLSRLDFKRDRERKNTPAHKQKWQRDYFHGPADELPVPHKTRLKVKPFRSS
jgi:hypothetical protein